MSEENDIFGQIDAIVGKRDTELLSERDKAGDDFPTLTDIISVEHDGFSSEDGTTLIPPDDPLSPSIHPDQDVELREKHKLDLSRVDEKHLWSSIDLRMHAVFSKYQRLLYHELMQIVQEEIDKASKNKRN